MKNTLLFALILLGGFSNSLFADVVYTANWERSDFSSFGTQGGIIEVLYQTDSPGSPGLPDDFTLSFEFAPFARQLFTFNASVLANDLMIGVNERYSATVRDTSQLTVEAAPRFTGWNLDERVLDQAGMALLGLYSDPKTNQEYFYETVFRADDITPDLPPGGVFRTFALTYENLVGPEVPSNQVATARYTLFSDTITYSRLPSLSLTASGGVAYVNLSGLAVGVEYILERSADLLPTGWTEVLRFTADATSRDWDEPLPGDRGFYRLRSWSRLRKL